MTSTHDICVPQTSRHTNHGPNPKTEPYAWSFKPGTKRMCCPHYNANRGDRLWYLCGRSVLQLTASIVICKWSCDHHPATHRCHGCTPICMYVHNMHGIHGHPPLLKGCQPNSTHTTHVAETPAPPVDARNRYPRPASTLSKAFGGLPPHKDKNVRAGVCDIWYQQQRNDGRATMPLPSSNLPAGRPHHPQSVHNKGHKRPPTSPQDLPPCLDAAIP